MAIVGCFRAANPTIFEVRIIVEMLSCAIFMRTTTTTPQQKTKPLFSCLVALPTGSYTKTIP
jgi:hypothetical protein